MDTARAPTAKPTIYFVVDQATRGLVGFSFDLGTGPDWDALAASADNESTLGGTDDVAS